MIALILVVVGPDRSGSSSATAQSATPVNVSGVVVDYGDGRPSYALVPFTEETISGVELLRRSGLSLLTVEFGSLGEGVCAIEETGCDLSACRTRLCQTGDPDSPFWQYVQADVPGAWQPAPLGASSSTVQNGDVDGWFWTGAAPRSTAVTLDVIATRVDVNLESFRSSAGADLEPVVMTVGGSANSDDVEQNEILAGVAIMIGIAVFGGLLILRSRRAAS